MNATAISNDETVYSSDITAASNAKVIRRKSPSRLLVSLGILAGGIVLLLWASGMTEKTTSVYSAALVFGIAAIGTGVCMALFGGKQLVYQPTKSTVKVHSRYIEPAQFHAVCQAIERRDISRLPKLRTLDNSSVRLDLYLSDDRQFAAAQAFHYVPYTYSPVTPVCCAYGEQAQALSHLI